MQCTNRMSKKRVSYLFSLAAASVLAAALAGCGGSSGGGGTDTVGGGTTTVVAPPVTTPGGATAAGAPTVNVAAAALAAAGGTAAAVDVGANPAQAFNAIVAAGAAPVTVNSPPVVNFAVIDSTGKHVSGLKLVNTTSSAAGLAADPNCSQSNVTFAMAKWDSAQNSWVSMISRQRYATADTKTNRGTTAIPKYRYAVVEGTTDPKPTASTTITKADGTTSTGAFANTAGADRIVGELTENSTLGYYTYNFATDVTTALKMADAVDVKNASVGKVANNEVVAVKDGKTLHRIGAQLCFTDSGTKAKVMVNPTIDFTISAAGVVSPVKSTDGKALAPYRQVVDKASCNECHSTLIAHGSRVDPQYCVICHNPNSTDYNTNNPIDLKVMLHRLHAGKDVLTKSYQVNSLVIKATDASGTVTGTAFSQNVKNCVKCHNGAAATATATSGKNVTTDGDNWKKVPSRSACGACHDGIDFAKNTGVTLGDYATGKTSSTIAHIGGAKADDTQCALCHAPADIATYHVPVASITNANVTSVRTYTANPDALPADAYKIEYVVSSVTVDSSRKVSVNFQIKKNGAAVNFGTYNATTNPNIIPNTVGGPSLAIAYNVPQDGNTSPADFNARMTAPALGVSAPTVSNSAATPPSTFTAPTTSTNLWVNPTGVTASGITWTMTGPDASNTYTIKSSLPLPAATTMVKAVMYGAMTQTNLSSYPYAAASIADFSSYKNAAGTTTSYVLTKPGLIIASDNASASVTSSGFTARRSIVDNAKCSVCHDQLGLFVDSAFHGGGRNDGTICNICHTPNGVNAGWSYSFNTFVHGIHGASKRTTKYTFASDWSTVAYPGVLKKCETCHVTGSYDYSATANAAAVSKLLYNTVATGTTSAAGTTTAPYIAQTAGTAYGQSFSWVTAGNAAAAYTLVDGSAGQWTLPDGTKVASLTAATNTTGATRPAEATTLVTSPIAAACFSCHDTTLAMGHMKQNGGAVYTARSTALTQSESCLLCHGTGATADIKAMHAK